MSKHMYSKFQYLAILQTEIKYFRYEFGQYSLNAIFWPGFYAAQMKESIYVYHIFYIGKFAQHSTLLGRS